MGCLNVYIKEFVQVKIIVLLNRPNSFMVLSVVLLSTPENMLHSELYIYKFYRSKALKDISANIMEHAFFNANQSTHTPHMAAAATK